MESHAPPQRRLRKIKRPKQATVKYGYGEQYEGTPEEAARYWAHLTGKTYEQYVAMVTGRQTYSSAAAAAAVKVTRTRSQHVRTTRPRVRSREMSHAPRRAARSTPKAAQRSGDSGDSTDPPGPEAALAALLQLVYPFGGWTS